MQASIADPELETLSDALLGANGLPGARIAFENVSFRYSDGAECVLEDVSFTSRAGKTTAIIGSTGSGKSTVLKLAERFHDVTSGRITVDGVDVRDVSQHALRAQLGYVPQAAFYSAAPSPRTWLWRRRCRRGPYPGSRRRGAGGRSSSPSVPRGWQRPSPRAARTSRAVSASVWP